MLKKDEKDLKDSVMQKTAERIIAALTAHYGVPGSNPDIGEDWSDYAKHAKEAGLALYDELYG